MDLESRTVVVGETEDGKVTFDSAAVFDALDPKDDDVLSYAKLNKVLSLTDAQYREFIYRMNDAAGESSSTQEVERHIFITKFLPIFGAVVHLDPNPDDAAHLFDEIAKHGTTKNGEIPHRMFFKSRLTEFLTEEQINTMLKDFQRTKELYEGDEFEKNYDPKKVDGPDAKLKEVPMVYRRSFFGLPERGFSVSRGDFIARYPTLLAEATSHNKRVASMVFTNQLATNRGIDIAFDKLSVSIDVKDRPVRVINSITGRLCAGTMTALMGGPRSGKQLSVHLWLSYFSKWCADDFFCSLFSAHREKIAPHCSQREIILRNSGWHHLRQRE